MGFGLRGATQTEPCFLIKAEIKRILFIRNPCKRGKSGGMDVPNKNLRLLFEANLKKNLSVLKRGVDSIMLRIQRLLSRVKILEEISSIL